MGIKDWLSGRRGVDREIQEMMNPLIAWRLQLRGFPPIAINRK